MLNIIYGASGTGKSELLYRRAAEAAASGKNVILFVPDQFSFEAEKKMYRTVEHKYSRFCRVSMFSREAQRILRKYGRTKEYADDIAKRIIMRSVLGQLRGRLEHYGSIVGKPGFAEFALGFVSDLRTAGLSPSKLRDVLGRSGSLSDALGRKMDEICMIYSAYDAELDIRFDDRLDDIRKAAELITENSLFDGCEVFFDEFGHFSGNQELFIAALTEKADNVTIAFTCDDINGTDRTFTAVRRTIMRLNGGTLPAAANVTKAPGTPKEPPELRIIEAADIWQECDWICAEIRSLMHEGVRCRDIAVITPVPDYDPVLASAVRKYDVPAFTDIPEPLITKSFVRFAIYTLRALSFETDDILRYIKSGYVRRVIPDPETGRPVSVRLSDIDMNKLERAARVYDLRAADWCRPFPDRSVLAPDADAAAIREIKELEELEDLRVAIIEPLTELKAAVTGSSGAQMTECLCRFLTEKMSLEMTVRGKCTVNGEFRQELFDTYDELWEKTVTVFESAHKALGDRVISLAEYTDILTDVFTATTVAHPPQFLDSVTLGDTSRSRFGSKSHVFLCGFGSGQFPPPAKAPLAFSASECDELADIGIAILPGRESRYSEELFTLYRCTHLPRQRLYITYAYRGSDGALTEPSPEVKKLAARRGVKIEGADSFGAAHYCRSPRSAGQYLAHIYNSSVAAQADERRALKKLLPGSGAVQEGFIEILDSASGRAPGRDRHLIRASSAAPLMNMDSYSPTAIEKLADCKFAYFCKYGLGLREDNVREASPAMTGNVVHHCLEHLLKMPGFFDMSYEETEAETYRAIAEYEQRSFFGSFGGSERFSFTLRHLAKYVVRAAVRMRDEMKNSGFRPIEYEKDLILDLGGVTVRGRCDRIDGMIAQDGRDFVRVVDYKHSRKLKFRLPEVYRGYNLQMLLYLFGICSEPALLGSGAREYFGGSVPAALEPSSVIYFKFASLDYGETDDPDSAAAPGGSDGAEYFNRDYFRNNSTEGLILKDSPEEEEMDRRIRDIEARYPAARASRTGSKGDEDNPRKLYSGFINSVQVTAPEFAELRGCCEALINTKVSEVLHGMAGACPSGEDACRWCRYRLFCGSNKVIAENAG
jgi:ATP-dependent helicase/nuclease subunit B